MDENLRAYMRLVEKRTREHEQAFGMLYAAGLYGACAGIIRLFAPEAELWSVRVLGANLRGQGAMLIAGIDWAVERGVEVLNLSLSSKSRAMFATLHEVADDAYFAGSTLVCAANNVPGPTYPSQFASVVSVAARPGDDPWGLACNPRPPVEFGARGIDVEVRDGQLYRWVR